MRKFTALALLVVGIVAAVDAADSLNCRLVGSCHLDDGTSVALSGNFAYVCGGYGSLYILDVSDPRAPYLVGRFDTTDMSNNVAVFLNLAYITVYGSFGGLRIVDVSDPQEPHAVGQYAYRYGFDHIVLSDDFDYAYLPDADHGLHILDITDPLKPYEAGYWKGLGSTHGVALSGNLAYVADIDSGLQIVDVSDPQAPHQVGGCSLPGHASSVAVSGDFAYVGGGGQPGKLWVIDVSNPQEPQEVGWTPLPDLGAAVVLSGNLVYVAVQDGYLYVIDVSDPHDPHTVGWYAGLESVADVAVCGNLAYTTDLKIIEFLGEGIEENTTPKSRHPALEVGPNPARGEFCVRYDVPATTRVSVGIYDAGGRLVRSLSEGEVSAGRYEARIPAGVLPAGIYFLRLDTPGFRSVKKAVVAR